MEATIKLPDGFICEHCPQINENTFMVKHKEPFFNSKRIIWVATFNEETKKARPCHGYFPPHKTGKLLKKFFTKKGFEFIG